jgi:hypothetical protein
MSNDVVEVTGDPSAVAAGGEPAGRQARRRRRLPDALTSIALVAAVLFGLGSVGSPLLGRSVYGPTDEMVKFSPYFDADPKFTDTKVQNTWLDDIYTAQLPNEELYGSLVRDGEPTGWNPYVSGGGPLGVNPGFAFWSPVSLPYLFLPAWLAPAYGKILEVLCAVLGMFLFLRRLGLRRSVAVVGGTIYAANGFLDMWVNFPQTRVAVFIPWVFWAAERLVTRRAVTDAVLLSIPVAAMLLGGFPAITALALLTAGIYLLVRVLAEYRRQVGTALAVIGGAAAAVVAGVGLAAAQLLPFMGFYSSWLIENREQNPSSHLAVESLATLFAPWVFGGAGVKPNQPLFYLPPTNIVETMSYLGAAAVVLVVVCLSLARPGRALLPKGVWVFLVACSAGWIAAIYIDGPMVVLHHLPIFSFNFIGRARSVLFLLLAVLAAAGFELLLRGRRELHRAGAPARAGQWYGLGVWTLGGIAFVALCAVTRRAAGRAKPDFLPGGVDPVRFATVHLLEGGALMLAVAGLAALLYWSPPRASRPLLGARFAAAALIPLLVAGQGLSVTIPYSPRADRATFYPRTDVQDFLAANLGSERFAGTWGAMPLGSDIVHRLRSISGHAFINQNLAAMLRGLPENPIIFETYINFTADVPVASSPVLDRLATKYFVTSPREPVLGSAVTDKGDGSTLTLQPGQTYAVPITQSGPLRGVGFTATALSSFTERSDSAVEVVVRNAATGAEVARSRRLTAAPTSVTSAIALLPGQPFVLPVTAETVPAGTPLVAELTMHTPAPVQVAARAGRPALSTVTAGNDGLRLVHAGSATVYQRLNALPRIRWAAQSQVEPDQQTRVGLLAGGLLPADEVLLNTPGPAADGRTASLDVGKDGTDEIAVSVNAQGAGYLVVADADQVGWKASVDGRAAALVPADQGVVAVHVPAGAHTVRLSFAAPHGRAGELITLTTIVVLVAVLGWSVWRTRRSPKTRTPSDPETHEPAVS